MTFHILSHASLDKKRSYSTCFPPAVPLVHFSLLKVLITRLITKDKSNGPFVYTLLSYELDLYLSEICQNSFAESLVSPSL